MAAEVRLGEELEGAMRQPVLAALDRGEGLAALAFQLGLGEGRLEQRLGEQVEGRREALARALERESQAAAPGEAVDLGGEALGRAREIRRGSPLGAAQPHGGEEAGEARAAGVLGELAAEQGRARRHHGHVAARQHVEPRLIRERVASGLARRRPAPRHREAALDPAGARRHGRRDLRVAEGRGLGLRQHGAHRERLGRQVLARHAQQLRGGRAAHAREVARLRAVVAGQQLEAAELLSEPRHALPREVLGGQEVGARLVELLPRDGLSAQPLDLAHGGGDRVPGALAVRLDADREETGIERREAGRVDAIGELVALLHALHQAAALAAAEHEGEQVEQRRVRVRELEAAPGELEVRALEAPRQHEAAQAALRRLGSALALGQARRRPGEGLAQSREQERAIEIPGRHHRELVRRVPAIEEASHPRAVEGRDALGRAQDRRAVGVRCGTPRSNTALPSTWKGESSPRRISSSTTSISRLISCGSKLECSTASVSTSIPISSRSLGSVAW